MTFDQFIQVIDILKWPLTAIVVFLILLKPIINLISRITSIKKSGFHVDTLRDPKTQETGRIDQSDDLMKAFDSEVLLIQEKAIKEGMKTRGLETEGDTVNALIRHLAYSQIINICQDIYRLIFGSQIYLLKRANENRLGLSESEVTEHFNITQSRYTESFEDWDVKQYLDFLLSRKLLLYENGNYRITKLGVAFLEWMTRFGIPDKRYL